MKKYCDILKENLRPGQVVGLIGAGQLGRELKKCAENCNCRVFLCDPPLAAEESGEVCETFFDLWGNGMGGCGLNRDDAETATYLPLVNMTAADIICIQVPVTADGKYPTIGMIDDDFMGRCRPEAKILCFSDAAVFALSAVADKRIIWIERQI